MWPGRGDRLLAPGGATSTIPWMSQALRPDRGERQGLVRVNQYRPGEAHQLYARPAVGAYFLHDDVQAPTHLGRIGDDRCFAGSGWRTGSPVRLSPPSAVVSRLGEIRPVRGLGLLVVAAPLLSWHGGVLSPLPPPPPIPLPIGSIGLFPLKALCETQDEQRAGDHDDLAFAGLGRRRLAIGEGALCGRF